MFVEVLTASQHFSNDCVMADDPLTQVVFPNATPQPSWRARYLHRDDRTWRSPSQPIAKARSPNDQPSPYNHPSIPEADKRQCFGSMRYLMPTNGILEWPSFEPYVGLVLPLNPVAAGVARLFMPSKALAGSSIESCWFFSLPHPCNYLQIVNGETQATLLR